MKLKRRRPKLKSILISLLFAPLISRYWLYWFLQIKKSQKSCRFVQWKKLSSEKKRDPVLLFRLLWWSKYLSSYQENVQWELSKSLFLTEKRRVANIGLHDNVTINEDFDGITIKRRKTFCHFTDFPNCFPVRFVYFFFLTYPFWRESVWCSHSAACANCLLWNSGQPFSSKNLPILCCRCHCSHEHQMYTCHFMYLS